LHYKLLPLMNAIFEDGSPGGIKVALNELDICGTAMREPLCPIRAEVAAKIKRLAADL